MKFPTPAALLKSSALAAAIIGGMMLGAPTSAEAAPAMAPIDILAPASDLTEVQYGGGHWRHHGRRHGRMFGHRGRHYGHHYGRRHHFQGRRYRY